MKKYLLTFSVLTCLFSFSASSQAAQMEYGLASDMLQFFRYNSQFQVQGSNYETTSYQARVTCWNPQMNLDLMHTCRAESINDRYARSADLLAGSAFRTNFIRFLRNNNFVRQNGRQLYLSAIVNCQEGRYGDSCSAN